MTFELSNFLLLAPFFSLWFTLDATHTTCTVLSLHYHLPLLTHGDKSSLLTAFFSPGASPALSGGVRDEAFHFGLSTADFFRMLRKSESAAEGVPQLTSLTWTDVFTGHCSCLGTVGIVGEDVPH